jgi:hypothetical protein
VLLKMKEVNRLRVMQGYIDGKILMEEAARILKWSGGSLYRMVGKVREKGPERVLYGTTVIGKPLPGFFVVSQ